jgi:histidyl-tRNA synthetase
MSYANDNQIAFVVIAGESEMQERKVTLKNMVSGEQQLVAIEELITKISI